MDMKLNRLNDQPLLLQLWAYPTQFVRHRKIFQHSQLRWVADFARVVATVLTSADNMFILVRNRSYTLSDRKEEFAYGIFSTTNISKRHSYPRIPSLGCRPSFNHTSSTSGGFTWIAVHSQAEDEEPDSSGSARERVSATNSGSNAGK